MQINDLSMNHGVWLRIRACDRRHLGDKTTPIKLMRQLTCGTSHDGTRSTQNRRNSATVSRYLARVVRQLVDTFVR